MTDRSPAPVNRSLLCYYGGKWRLAPWIIANLPPHRVYIEPFGGGAGVLLRKPRSEIEIYNDLDQEIVNVFRQVRCRGPELRALLDATPYARAEYEESFVCADNPLEQARRTIVRSLMGFGSNSINRAIQSGFKVDSSPRSSRSERTWANYGLAMPALIERLRGVVIENSDALEVMRRHDREDALHYVDPPYVLVTRSSKTNGEHGYRFEYTETDHERLAEMLHTLRGAVVVSGYRCPLYERLYGGWRQIQTRARADGARARTEVLWLSPGVQPSTSPRSCAAEFTGASA